MLCSGGGFFHSTPLRYSTGALILPTSRYHFLPVHSLFYIRSLSKIGGSYPGGGAPLVVALDTVVTLRIQCRYRTTACSLLDIPHLRAGGTCTESLDEVRMQSMSNED